MADKPDANAGGAIEATPPGKKKMILLALIAVVVLLVLALAGWFYLSRQHADLDDEGDGEEVVQTEHAAKTGGAPTFLPLDAMVVNLADPGGEKVVQLGVTLELVDAKATAQVKPYLPAIRNSVLMLVSQSTSEALLKREGKEQLATDIFREASRNFVPDEAIAEGRSRKKKGEDKQGNPIRRVLFFSFIVQ